MTRRRRGREARDTLWWHYRRSLAGRVTLLTIAAVAVSIAVISLGAYITIRHQLQASTDSSLLERARSVASDNELAVSISRGDLIPTWALGAADVRVAELSAEHTMYIPAQETTTFPSLGTAEYEVATGRAASSVRTINGPGDIDYRVVAVPIPGSAEALVLALPLEAQHAMFRRVGIVTGSFGFTGVIIAGFLGWAVATSGLRPVRRLTGDVEQLARTGDLTPLPVAGRDEIARLTTTFNTLLAALDDARSRQRQLVADASHELRTPLTSLRTNIDLLTQADTRLDAVSRAELMQDLRAQVDEMTTLIGDLVELARDKPSATTIEPVDVSAILNRALERVRRRAPSLTWEVDAESWWVLGEDSGIERAITNLLDNAAKWSPPESSVHLTLREGTLTVDDSGPGIAESDLPHVFDRFYRSRASRAMPGSGLGLAIVRQAAERLGGSVSAERSPYGGARLVLRLPGSADPPPRRSSSAISAPGVS